jgi:hypothetical protein
MSGMFYAIVDPEETLSAIKKKRMDTFEFFGMEDSIYNHLKLLQAHQKKKKTSEAFLKFGEDLLKKRQFTIQAIR